jgi:hypothetical protein
MTFLEEKKIACEIADVSDFYTKPTAIIIVMIVRCQ